MSDARYAADPRAVGSGGQSDADPRDLGRLVGKVIVQLTKKIYNYGGEGPEAGQEKHCGEPNGPIVNTPAGSYFWPQSCYNGKYIYKYITS